MKELSLNRANCGARSARQQVQDGSEPVRRRRPGLGTSGRSERSREPRQESPRRDQSLLGREAVSLHSGACPTELIHQRTDVLRTELQLGGAGRSRSTRARPPTCNRAATLAAAFLTLRKPIPAVARRFCSAVFCIAVVFGVWWLLTRGEREERILSPIVAAQPGRNIRSEQLRSPLVRCALTRNLLVSLRRVVLGFSLAAAVGIPLGVLCGCFPWVNASCADQCLRPKHSDRGAHSADVFAFRHRRVSEGDVHLHRRGGVHHDGYRVRHGRRQQPLHRHGLHARRDAAADHPESPRAAGDAARVQLAAAAVRPGVRLHHAGRVGHRRWRRRRPGRIINIAQRRGHGETILLVLMIIPAVALAIDRVLY